MLTLFLCLLTINGIIWVRGFSKSLVNHKVSMAVAEVSRGVPLVSYIFLTRAGVEEEADVGAEERGD